jgi:hypothetical protein
MTTAHARSPAQSTGIHLSSQIVEPDFRLASTATDFDAASASDNKPSEPSGFYDSLAIAILWGYINS